MLTLFAKWLDEHWPRRVCKREGHSYKTIFAGIMLDGRFIQDRRCLRCNHEHTNETIPAYGVRYELRRDGYFASVPDSYWLYWP